MKSAAELMKHEPQADLSGQLMESVLLSADLSKLSASDRVRFYKAVCDSVGLNPLTKPFAYINLNGKLTLYCTKDATDQLRKRDKISIEIMSREVVEDVYVVTARATDASGRTDESIGAVPIGTLKGEARSNSMMKAEAKAKRRVTLSICGLGMVDATETDSIPTAQRVPVDTETGEIVGAIEDAAEIPDGGSREAQEAVRDRKLAEIASEPEKLRKGPQATASKNPKGDWYKIMLQGFEEMKNEIPKEDYYRVLGSNGFEHANEIPDRPTAMRIYKEMGQIRSLLISGEDIPVQEEPAQ